MKILKLILTLSAFLTSCVPTNTTLATITAIPLQTFTPKHTQFPTSTQTQTPTPTQTEASSLLPHSLYFLGGPWEKKQVWRMEADGTTRTQLTEEVDVGYFDVSSIDGSIAFVSNNQLLLMDSNGENRRLIADDSQLPEEYRGTYEHGTVEYPVFSPDGQILAYALDGLHLYNIATGEDKHVLTNMGNLLGTPYVFSKELYSPASWSPDGSKLLFTMSYFEGSTLGVMEPAASQPFRRLLSEGPVCCDYSWTPDSRSVLVANPDFGVHAPGLWSYDADTGKESLILGGVPKEDEKMQFVSSPLKLASGEFLFFHTQLERLDPDVGIPLVMVRSDSKGSIEAQLRPEQFHIRQVLWAQDGSWALILGSIENWDRKLYLAPSDGSPLKIIIEDAKDIWELSWGP